MDEFSSPNRQLKKAIRKTHQFYKMRKSYLESEICSTVVEFHPDTGCNLHKKRITTFPSDDMTDIVVDAVDAFRSTLEHVAYASATISGVSGKSLERINFPITKDPAKFEDTISRCCVGIDPRFVDVFRSHKPYPGGNDALSNLNLIRKQGYHRIIVPVAAIAEVKPDRASMRGKRPDYIPAPVWDGANHEITFISESPDGRFGYDAKLSFDITFGEVEGVAHMPVWTFLIETAEAVDAVVKEAEIVAESVRSKP